MGRERSPGAVSGDDDTYHVRDAISTPHRKEDFTLTPQKRPGPLFLFKLGMYDVLEFTAVIDPAHGAILAVGAIEEKPVLLNGQIVVRHRMPLTGSFDHRTIDGAMGASFCRR